MKRILAQLILVADTDNTSLQDRLQYIFNLLIHFAPVAFVLDLVNWWFRENQQFGAFISIALVVNMIVGCYMHLQNKSFNFKEFLLKNIEMGFVVGTVYLMLELMRYTAGDNIAGEMFRILIQLITLMYPTSKVFKNIYIITEGKYPPEFIMNRLYNFEKNGDLNDLFKTKNDEE